MANRLSKAEQEHCADVEANWPGDKEVVVRLSGHLCDNGKQAMDAWWLPGRPDRRDQPAAQVFNTSPEAFRKLCEHAGYTVRVLPHPDYRWNQPRNAPRC